MRTPGYDVDVDVEARANQSGTGPEPAKDSRLTDHEQDSQNVLMVNGLDLA